MFHVKHRKETLTNTITRETAEVCVEQIQLMYQGFTEPQGFGKPVPSEDPDNEGCWLVRWDLGPYLFGAEPLHVPEGRPESGVFVPPAWPVGVAVDPVANQVVRLRPA